MGTDDAGVKMADVHGDVLHQREARGAWGHRRLHGGDRVDDEDSGSDSESSYSSGSRSPGSNNTLDPEENLGWIRAISPFDAESVTHWGMLIGKMLRRRVHHVSKE